MAPRKRSWVQCFLGWDIKSQCQEHEPTRPRGWDIKMEWGEAGSRGCCCSLCFISLNQGGFSGKVNPPGSTFGSGTLLLFELGSLTLDLLSLCAFQIALTSRVSGGEIWILKWTKSLQALSSAAQVLYLQWHVHPSLFPLPFLVLFYSLSGKGFSTQTLRIRWLQTGIWKIVLAFS